MQILSQKHLDIRHFVYICKMLEEYKRILKELGVTGKDISKLLGIRYDSYRSVTRKGAKVTPYFVKGFVICYKLMKL